MDFIEDILDAGATWPASFSSGAAAPAGDAFTDHGPLPLL